MKEKNQRNIRNIKNIPSANIGYANFVSEDFNLICENTMGINRFTKQHKAEWGISSTECEDGTKFDLGPSGGAGSFNTEVNAENQGIISEVPIAPEFRPKNK